MDCNCTDGCERCGREPVIREVFNCPGSQRIIRHEHIVRHQHDVIHEFDIIHEHEFNTRDIVREREVVNHVDCRTHEPNYCCDDRPMQVRPRLRSGWRGRRW